MPAYDDRRFSPPAPVVEVSLRNPQTKVSVFPVMMLMDTGADVTLLPKAQVESVGIERSGPGYELSGFDGSKSIAYAVRAELSILGRTFRGQFLLIDDPVGILGRDILNSLSLLLDGPQLAWGEHRPEAGS
jgi:hypothetical protein